MGSSTGKKLLSGICVAGAAVAALEAASRLQWNRSASATAEDALVRAFGWRREFRDPDLFSQFIERAKIINEEPYEIEQPTRALMRSLVFQETRDEMRTFHIGTTGNNARAVLYLHGGAYVGQITSWHWLFCDRLCRRTGAEVVVPVYPLAPQHGYESAYDELQALYAGMVERYGADAITLMGDGAGAGLALGLIEAVSEAGFDAPARCVLISPEVDLSFSNPAITSRVEKDSMLSVWGLYEAGKLWADGDDLSGWRLSPLEGDLSCLREVAVYLGTDEVLYPDGVELHDRLVAAGARSRLYVGQNLGHSWPLWPTLEGAAALKQISEFVLGARNS